MARPRIHDEDMLLDTAEQLLLEDPSALTIRALAQRSGASSGTLYHSFHSRTELLGRMWLRGARMYLELQEAAIEEVLGDGEAGRERAAAATVAASLTLLRFSAERPATANLLVSFKRDSLLGSDLPEELVQALRGLDAELLEQMKRLARSLTGRADRRTVDIVAACLVDLPSAFVPGRRPRVADTERLLEAAVRGVLGDAL